MTEDNTKVIDSNNGAYIDLLQYQKCQGIVLPRLEAFLSSVTLGSGSNVQTHIEVLTLCPWHLTNSRSRGDMHTTQELIEDAVDYPGGDINNPYIEAITSLDTTILHEV
jgi:hypothetical protein